MYKLDLEEPEEPETAANLCYIIEKGRKFQ